MINIRYFAIAFIENNQKTLMMKRNGSSEIATNLWAPVGGHIEEYEHRQPEVACYREIFEETGISKDDLEDLNLRYIVMRLKKNEIRVQYVFYAKTRKDKLANCEEGDLYWIKNNEIESLHTTFTTSAILKENKKENMEKNIIKVGVVEVNDNVPEMKWSNIKDWDNLNFI